MNDIQQISLMLRLGIDPETNISPETLRAVWLEKSAEKYGPARKAVAKLCAAQAAEIAGKKHGVSALHR